MYFPTSKIRNVDLFLPCLFRVFYPPMTPVLSSVHPFCHGHLYPSNAPTNRRWPRPLLSLLLIYTFKSAATPPPTPPSSSSPSSSPLSRVISSSSTVCLPHTASSDIILIIHHPAVTQGNHTVTQSTFASPCIAAHETNSSINGFDSGFRDTVNGTAVTILSVPITADIANQTLWFFDYNTCGEGGVGGINPNQSSLETLAGFEVSFSELLNCFFGEPDIAFLGGKLCGQTRGRLLFLFLSLLLAT